MPDGTNQVILTETQKAFLSKYLKGGFLFTPKSDKEKTKNFKKLVRVEAAAREYLAKLDPAGPDATRVAASLQTAMDLKNAGDFEQAFTTARQALTDAAEVIGRTERKEELLQRLGGIAIPDRASDMNRRLMTGKITDITTALAGTPPTTADMDGTDAHFTVLETLRDQAEAEARKVSGDIVLLGQSERIARAKLDTLVAQIARAATAPNHADLDREARRLAGQIEAMREAVMSGDAGLVALEVGDLDSAFDDLDALAADTATALKSDMPDIDGMANRTPSQIETLKDLAVLDPALKDAAAAALDGFDATLQGQQADQAAIVAAAQAIIDAEEEVKQKRTDRQNALDAKQQLLAGMPQVRQQRTDAIKRTTQRLQSEAVAANNHYLTNKAILEDEGHEDYEAAWDYYERNFLDPHDATKAQLAQEKKTLLEDEANQLRAADARITQARTALTAAKGDLVDKRNEHKVLDGKKRLLEAITYGPLAPHRKTDLTSAQKIALIQLYAENPRLADQAATTAATAEHPESVVTVARSVIGRVDTNFGARRGLLVEEDVAANYATSLVQMSAILTPDEASGLDAYLDAERHLEAKPALIPTGSLEETGKKRADFMSEALVGADGRLKFDQAKEAMQDVTFHPNAALVPSFAQVEHMRDTLEFFDSSNDAQDLIYNMPLPQAANADVLAREVGKPREALDQSDARHAVVSAMMTPIYQGPVGSCFTTGPLRKLRADKPLDVMRGYTKLATEGVFEPYEGDPLPAVQNVPANENRLVRSFEYTAAAATSRLAEGVTHTRVGKMTDRAGLVVGKVLGMKLSPEEQEEMNEAVNDAFEIQYDPQRAIEGNDGHSSHGGFVLIRKYDKRPVKTPEDFIAGVIRPMADKKGKLSKSDVKQLRRLAKNPKFLNAMNVQGKSPWSLASGGFSSEAAQVLEGRTVVPTKATDRTDAATLDREARAKDLVTNFASIVGVTTDKTIPITTSGEYNHALNLLPNHPSMDPFASPDPDKVAEAVEEKMLAPGRQVATAQMPLERVVFLFDREMQALVTNTEGPERDALKAAWAANAPTQPMTPREFADHLELATDAWADLKAQAGVDRWTARKTAAGTPPDAAAQAAEKAGRRTVIKAEMECALSSRLIADFDLPEIVLADTNWGDPTAHVYFALAPDPLTGEPRLFKKLDPPGLLTWLEDDESWLAAKWNANL